MTSIDYLNRTYRVPTNKEMKLGWFSFLHWIYSPGVIIAWFSLHLNISANQLTYFWHFLGLIGSLLLFHNYIYIGLFIIWLSICVDYADGVIAKHTGTYTEGKRKAKFLDNLGHIVWHQVLFVLALSTIVYGTEQNIFFIALGIIFSFSLILKTTIPRFITVKDTKISYTKNSVLKQTISAALSTQSIIFFAIVSGIFNILHIYLILFSMYSFALMIGTITLIIEKTEW